MDEVRNHRAFVDGETGDDFVALLLEGSGFPPDLTGIGNDAATDGEVLDVLLNDAGRQEVEFYAGGSMAGVGPAVDLQHRGNGARCIGELATNFRNEATFAFVAEGNSDIGDQLAGKGSQRHFFETLKTENLKS